LDLIVLPVDIIKEVPLPAVLGVHDESSGAYQLTGLLSFVLFRESPCCRVYLAFVAGSSLEQTLSLLKLKTTSSKMRIQEELGTVMWPQNKNPQNSWREFSS